jgi:hypothetical protein
MQFCERDVLTNSILNQLDDDEDDDEDEEEMKEAAPLRKKTEREIELELGDDYILGEFRFLQPISMNTESKEALSGHCTHKVDTSRGKKALEF